MPFAANGTYTAATGATTAFSGQTVASATWNAIFTDFQTALTSLGKASLLNVRASSDFPVTSSTALVNVTGLSLSVLTTGVYAFEASLFCTDAAAGGVKASIAGTATATSIIYNGYIVDNAAIVANTQATALGSTVASSTTTGTTPYVVIKGLIVVNASGTLTVQFAQNTSNGTASTVKAGSWFRAWAI